ncbi:hypothetical protein HYDPIDRAFT_79376 [Hydnomerulius pinastri MD-312]|nr:hypothetical protein HYDPIDRAFT_79376 [Hydnomerulius pinastri MD-312]
MSFARRSQSPPPPMPSPQLVPTPLPSPPPFTKKPSKSRLTVPTHHSPAIPPSLIGSPLLKKTLNSSRSHERLDRKAKAGLFGDDDEFGARKSRENRRCPSTASLSSAYSSPRSAKRTLGQLPLRCRSPPPSPAIASPPPPVPPIPAFMLAPTDKRSVLQPSPRRSSAQHSILDLYMDQSAEDASLASRKRCESTPGGALTCMQFFAMHNSPRRDCRV